MKIKLNFQTSVLVTFLIIIINNVNIAQNFTRQEQVVQQCIIKLFDEISINNAAGIKLYCLDDVKFYEYGQIWTIDTFLQKLSTLPGPSQYNRANKFDFVSTSVKGNIAWATYYLESTITRTGKTDIIKWMETVILLKEKNQWKLSVLHSTRLSKN